MPAMVKGGGEDVERSLAEQESSIIEKGMYWKKDSIRSRSSWNCCARYGWEAAPRKYQNGLQAANWLKMPLPSSNNCNDLYDSSVFARERETAQEMMLINCEILNCWSLRFNCRGLILGSSPTAAWRMGVARL